MALRIIACGNCNGIARASAASMYGLRPCNNGNGHTIQVEMARPRYSLCTVSGYISLRMATYTTLPRMDT